MLVVINAGHHPGVDPGCSGIYTNEADLAKKYAEAAISYLTQAGVECVFLQNDDLNWVCRTANEKNADLFVSIHLNAFNNQANGTETLYHKNSANGKKLAQCLQDQMISTLGLTNRGIKADVRGLAVLRRTDMPAALIEVGFLDNPSDEQVLINRVDDIARAIARAVTDYPNK